MFAAYDLPVQIVNGGQTYPIRGRGDYRVMLDVLAALNDEELTEEERIECALLIFLDTDIYALPDIEGAAVTMMEFIRAGYPESKGSSAKLMDWEEDAPMIISGVNRVLNTEVRAVPYMHWWSFFAAYMEIGESTLATVISIRDKVAKGKKLEKYEQEFKREHPELFTFRADRERARRDMEDIAALWGV